MDRAAATGLGVSVVGHVALLALLSHALVTATNHPITPPAMEVSFVDEVALTSASPQPSPTPAAQARAPELGPVEDAAPAPAPQAPTPPVPRDAVPAPSPIPAPRPPSRALTRPAPPATAGTGQTTRRPGLGDLDPRAFGRDPASHTNNPPAAVMSASALADIRSAIERQIQPCAGRRSNLLGDGAERIRVTLNLRLGPDGALAAAPTLVPGRTTGVDDENRRFARQVGDLILAATRECSPLRGLPSELYRTPTGGWSNINVTFGFPGR
jgi:hypothetical protein